MIYKIKRLDIVIIHLTHTIWPKPSSIPSTQTFMSTHKIFNVYYFLFTINTINSCLLSDSCDNYVTKF